MRVVSLILLLFSIDVVTGVEPVVYKELTGEPTWMTIDNDTLYVVYQEVREYRIVAFNMNDEQEEEILISEGFTSATDLLIAENFLMTRLDYNEKGDPYYYSRLYKIALSDPQKMHTAISLDLNFIGFCYNGNGHVYFTEENTNDISRYDLYQYNSIKPKLFYSQYENPTSVLFHNHNLWVMHDNGTKISKLTVLTADRVSTEVFSDLPPSTSMKVEGNFAYVTQYEGNKIYRFSLDDPNPEIEEVVQFDINAYDSEYYKGDLYYTLKEEQKIMVVRNVVTSIDIPEFLQTTISPNPTSDFVSLPSLTSPTTIEVFNSSGILVLTKKVSPNEDIDISNIVSGTYTIRTENNLFGRFIKLD